MSYYTSQTYIHHFMYYIIYIYNIHDMYDICQKLTHTNYIVSWADKLSSNDKWQNFYIATQPFAFSSSWNVMWKQIKCLQVFPSWEKEAYEEWSPRKLTSVKSRSPILSDTIACDLVVHQSSFQPTSCKCSIKTWKNNLPPWITTYPKLNLHIELEWK